MALCNSKSPTLTHFQIQQSQPIFILTFLKLTIFLFLLFPFANSISFNFPNFQADGQDIDYHGNAYAVNDVIQFNQDRSGSTVYTDAAQATYAKAIHLWDNETGNLTDFNTHFSFNITALNLSDTSQSGDGLTFFLSPFNATIPQNSAGPWLGLFDSSLAMNNTASNQIVAVEFDTYKNDWDPSSDHVGIDINTIVSVATATPDTSMKNGTIANVWVNYNSSTTTLSVYLTYAKNPVFQGDYNISYAVDLREFLPEWVRVGFSASTGNYAEVQNIVSWNFSSTLGDQKNSTLDGYNHVRMGHMMRNLLLRVCLPVIGALLSCGVVLFCLLKLKQNRDMGVDARVNDDDFEKGTGPRRFTFRELSRATNNFSERGKLGQDVFGGVYKGVLTDTKREIAVRRISKGSKQGKKEYVAEVEIISRLRHQNLVQLIGWCHEQREFLLVYEFMPNGSLDTHLFQGKSKLRWATRYKIALDLASAILYLHEEREQCVVHRDIKSSNVMLDSNCNARLGDFGLARFVDHELGLETTSLAGTMGMGYIAPECVFKGKASKESDVYSFGVVALEIACGRRPAVELEGDSGHIRLSEWVWIVYGKEQLFDVVDEDLKYDESQLERLMLVGLWCCHPDPNLRPSIRQAINVLTFEAPLPDLPSQPPIPGNLPPISRARRSSSIQTTSSDEDKTHCSSTNNTSPVQTTSSDEDNTHCSSINNTSNYYSAVSVEICNLGTFVIA